MINEINNFCKIRDENRSEFSNRAKFLVNLLTRLNIEHKLVRTKSKRFNKYFYNIYCFGSSDKFLSAHYDVANTESDNANDNSASVINCIAYKQKNSSINLLLLDGEEPPFMGVGSNLAARYMKANGILPKWILNLELTGFGNSFFIDNVDTQLSRCIQQNFEDAIITSVPFNDAMIFRQHGIESNVLTCLNVKENGAPDFSVFGGMHTAKDNLATISTEDMNRFVNETLNKIVTSC